MKIFLITGGAGFIGTNLSIKLIKQGNSVICVDNLITGKLKNVKFLKDLGKSNFKFINHDIVKKIDIKTDYIFNLACPASPPKYQKSPIDTLVTNFNGTINMCELALKNNCPILHTSTSEVYGDPLISPQSESYKGNVNTIGPRACYDEGKRVSETLIYEFNKIYKLNAKIVRIFNTYGPFMDKDDGRVVTNFINQAIKNKNINIYGNGRQTRSFCFVEDTIDGILKYSNLKRKYLGPINIGNNNELSIKEISKKIISLTKSKSKVKYSKLPIDDPLQRLPDIRLAKKLLNWEPKISLDSGLLRTIEYFKNN